MQPGRQPAAGNCPVHWKCVPYPVRSSPRCGWCTGNAPRRRCSVAASGWAHSPRHWTRWCTWWPAAAWTARESERESDGFSWLLAYAMLVPCSPAGRSSQRTSRHPQYSRSSRCTHQCPEPPGVRSPACHPPWSTPWHAMLLHPAGRHCIPTTRWHPPAPVAANSCWSIPSYCPPQPDHGFPNKPLGCPDGALPAWPTVMNAIISFLSLNISTATHHHQPLSPQQGSECDFHVCFVLWPTWYCPRLFGPNKRAYC